MERRSFIKSLLGIAAVVTVIPSIILDSGSKLKATFTQETAADLSTIYGINAEEELMTLLSRNIQSEIDREILNDLFRLQGEIA
jgi:hypothetical protein